MLLVKMKLKSCHSFKPWQLFVIAEKSYSVQECDATMLQDVQKLVTKKSTLGCEVAFLFSFFPNIVANVQLQALVTGLCMRITHLYIHHII